MRTLLTAALLTLSVVLSLGSALLLTLTTLEVINPSSHLSTLFVYLLAATPSYFIMKSIVEILKPQTVIQANSVGELLVKQPEQTPQQVAEVDAEQVERQTAESTKLAQTTQKVNSAEPKIVEKDEPQQPVTTIETKPETPSNPQPHKGENERVNEETVKIFMPLLDELRSIQNELDGLKSRLRNIKENLTST